MLAQESDEESFAKDHVGSTLDSAVAQAPTGAEMPHSAHQFERAGAGGPRASVFCSILAGSTSGRRSGCTSQRTRWPVLVRRSALHEPTNIWARRGEQAGSGGPGPRARWHARGQAGGG